jgi:hypothetical protein
LVYIFIRNGEYADMKWLLAPLTRCCCDPNSSDNSNASNACTTCNWSRAERFATRSLISSRAVSHVKCSSCLFSSSSS